jgi:hypothetical protein
MAAGKKPAKKNFSNTVEKKAEAIGKPVYYLGLGNKSFTCPTCNRNVRKGIVYEHSNRTFCKRGCIKTNENS